ncbi:MAG TPA: hypothetical protein VF409_14020 [Sphingomonas sp.]
MAAIGGLIGVTAGLGLTQVPIGQVAAVTPGRDFVCTHPQVIDDVTLVCAGVRIHLAGVALAGTQAGCGGRSRCASGSETGKGASLQSAIGGATLRCHATEPVSDNRVAAACTAGGRDLSCVQIGRGAAVRNGAEAPSIATCGR